MMKTRTAMAAQDRRLAELERQARHGPLAIEDEAELEELALLANQRRSQRRLRIPRQIAAARAKLASLEATARRLGLHSEAA